MRGEEPPGGSNNSQTQSVRWRWRLARPFHFGSHLITKRDHAVLIAFDFRQMKGGISVEILEERDPLTDQDRQDGITNLVGQPATKAFASNYPTSYQPDAAKRRPQTSIHELRQIAGVELDGIPGPRQLSTREDENGFVAIRPPQSFGFKTQRGLIGSLTHDVTVDRLKDGLDEFWVPRVSAGEFVCGFEPVDAPVLSRDDAVKARDHVNRYPRIRVSHDFWFLPDVKNRPRR